MISGRPGGYQDVVEVGGLVLLSAVLPRINPSMRSRKKPSPLDRKILVRRRV